MSARRTEARQLVLPVQGWANRTAVVGVAGDAQRELVEALAELLLQGSGVNTGTRRPGGDDER
jgi:hypothetical protein